MGNITNTLSLLQNAISRLAQKLACDPLNNHPELWLLLASKNVPQKATLPA